MTGFKIILKQITGFMVFILVLPGMVHAGEPAKTFQDGVKNYNKGNYPEAIVDFSEIVDGGIKNGKLFYNLGNAYLKNGNTGYAILWYKRALQLMPNDPDLKFNYNIALSRVKDLTPENKNPVLKIIFFWKYLLSRPMLQWTGIILNSIFWLLLTFQQIFRTNALQIFRNMTLFLAVVITLTASYNYYEDIHNKQAIILPAEVSVRSGLSDMSTQLFVLHAGSQVKIDEEKNGFFKIRFSNNKIGWINKKAAGVI